MIKTTYVIALFLLLSFNSFAQTNYNDSLQTFIKNYVDKHEVVTGNNKKFFDFYPVNANYRIIVGFERVKDAAWFSMPTSGIEKQVHRVYGTIHFIIHDTTVNLNIYQSRDLLTVAEYKDYLFLPFTDLTSGEETYASGRYIDLKVEDIVNDKIVIDFNKAYNPYCAYVTGKYNCPIPPKENNLNVAIVAGEKNYNKPH